MRALITKKTIVIAAVAVLLAISTLVSINLLGRNSIATNAGGVFSRPLRVAVSAVAQIFEGVYVNMDRMNHLTAENDRLHREYADLLRDVREIEALRAENAWLREVLDFSERHGHPTMADGIILNPGGNNFRATFVINLGSSNSDIAVGNSVITGYGMLLGVVTDVGLTSSTVMSILDTLFAAEAMVGEVGPVTARGNFSYMSDGLLTLDHIGENAPIVPGAQVVTTGGGGVFPPGLIIGEVAGVYLHDTGLGMYATVRPRALVEHVTHIAVITGHHAMAN